MYLYKGLEKIYFLFNVYVFDWIFSFIYFLVLKGFIGK